MRAPARHSGPLFDAAVAAADPRKVLASHLPPKPTGRCIVVGCGKSAAVMAAALEDAWPDVALRGHRRHPLRPRRADAADRRDRGLASGARRRQRTRRRRLLERVRGLGPDDLVLALISGGGSALCAAAGRRD